MRDRKVQIMETRISKVQYEKMLSMRQAKQGE